MKARFPIYAKLLFWFFINLIVLACAGWFVLRGQLRFTIFSESAVTGRVEQVASQLVKELPFDVSPKWSEVVEKYRTQHGVEFYCYDDQGRLLAGPTSPIPATIHSRIGGGPRRGPDGPGRRPPPEDEGPEGRPPREPGMRPGSPLPRVEGPPPPVSRFVAESSDPHIYWVGIRIEDLVGGERPGYVLTSSPSSTGRGLYFDVQPFVWSGIAVLALSALIWFPFVRSLTRSVKAMRDTTGRLAEGEFEARVQGARRDELGELGEGINRMAVRLKGYVEGQKRFLSDVAHELCAPTARLQMSLGILEQRAPESERERLADVREEVEHMSALVHELLQFSKAGIAANKVQLQSVDLRAIAEKAIHREGCEPGQITIAIPENERPIAEPDLLFRALSNLIRNALRYAGSGPIFLSAEAHGETLAITLADEGPGIPEADLPKIFDPFYRLDQARTKESGGVGLGLAIVKTCVEACQGTVTATNRTPHGLAVVVTLKRA